MVREAGYTDIALQEDELFSPAELDSLAGALITLRTPQMEELLARKIPCVFISSLGNPYHLPSVIPDFYQGSRDVMLHLIRRGYRRIGCITIDSGEFNRSSFLPREQAYSDVLRETASLSLRLWNGTSERRRRKSDSGSLCRIRGIRKRFLSRTTNWRLK